MRANTGLIMLTTTTLLAKVQDLQQKLQLGGNQSLPSQLEARMVSHNKCLRLVDCCGCGVTILTPSKTILQLE